MISKVCKQTFTDITEPKDDRIWLYIEITEQACHFFFIIFFFTKSFHIHTKRAQVFSRKTSS